MQLVPIGIFHTPYRTKDEAPRQGRHSEVVAYIEIFEKYLEGLKDIEEAKYLIILYKKFCRKSRPFRAGMNAKIETENRI